MPAYNAGKYITRALTSIEAQTRPADEVLVVDDGSTDDTFARIHAFALSSGLNIVFRRQPNGGSSAARNHAIRLSSGNLIAFMDADDIMYPTFLERMETGLDRHPDWVVCFSDRDIVDADGRLIAKHLDHPKFRNIVRKSVDMGFMELADDALFSKMLGGSLIPMTMVCRRTEIDALRGFDESLIFNEDRLFFLELIKRGGKFGFAIESLGTWQRHETNKTGASNAIRRFEASDLILQRLLIDKVRLKLTPKELTDIDAEQRKLAVGWMYAASHNGSASTFSLGRRLMAERRITLTCFMKAIARWLLASVKTQN